MREKLLITAIISFTLFITSCATTKSEDRFLIPEEVPIYSNNKVRETAYDNFKLAYIIDKDDSYITEYFRQGNKTNRKRLSKLIIEQNNNMVPIEELFRQSETAYEEFQLGLIFKKKEQSSKKIATIGSYSLVGGVFSYFFFFLLRGLDAPTVFSNSIAMIGTTGIIAGGIAYPIGAFPRYLNNTLKHSAFRTATAYYNIWLRDYYSLNNP